MKTQIEEVPTQTEAIFPIKTEAQFYSVLWAALASAFGFIVLEGFDWGLIKAYWIGAPISVGCAFAITLYF